MLTDWTNTSNKGIESGKASLVFKGHAGVCCIIYNTLLRTVGWRSIRQPKISVDGYSYYSTQRTAKP